MSFILFTDEHSPKCRKAIGQTTIDAHPTIPSTALQIYQCADCGPVMTKMTLLLPKKPANKQVTWIASVTSLGCAR
jgi:hypothetical protein